MISIRNLVSFFSKSAITFTVLATTVLLVSCNDDTNRLDLDKDPLKGKIGGAEWQYTVGNAQYSPFNNEATGIIINLETTEPCGVTNTILAHIKITIPTIKGTINLPDPQNRAIVKLANPNGGPIYTTTGGFIQIVEVNSREIIGYISADYDDDNYVQGSFLVEICN